MKSKSPFLGGSKAPRYKKKTAAMCCASLLAAALAAFPAVSRADTLKVTGWWGVGNTAVNTSILTPLAEATAAGGFATSDITTSQSFQSWCADIFDRLSFGTSYMQYSGPVLASSFFDSTRATDLAILATQHASVVTGAINTIPVNDEAAFQMAVWEIIFEAPSKPFNVLADNFSVSANAATTLANTWLGQISTFSGSLAFTPEIWVSSAGHTDGHRETQNLLVFAPGGYTNPPIPEPETYAMMLAGLGLMGFVARRRKSTERSN